MDSFSGDQWRGRWKSRLTINYDYSVAWVCTTHWWRCQWGLRSEILVNSSSFKAIIQQGFRSRGRLAGGKDRCMDLLDQAWLVCSDCIVLRAWYDQLCMRIVTWYLWHILYIDSWGFQLQAFLLNNCVNVCEFFYCFMCALQSWFNFPQMINGGIDSVFCMKLK